MSSALHNLLAADAMARKLGVGGGLSPRLRAAIEQDIRMPVRSAGPRPSAQQVDAASAPNVTRIADWAQRLEQTG